MNASFGSICLSGFAVACLAVISPADGGANQWTLVSPNQQLAVTLALRATGAAKAGPAGLGLYYKVERGSVPQAGVIGWSPLGIVRDDQRFVEDLTFQGASAVTTIDERYTMPHGKRRQCRSYARQQSLRFANKQGTPLEIVVRAANDGVAFRYRFPAADQARRTITEELTGFQLQAADRAWMTPNQEASQYTPSYEADYLPVAAGTASPNEAGWAFPALFQTADGGRWLLVTEAAVDESYCGCRLRQSAPEALYQIRFPDPDEGHGQGVVEPSSSSPWSTPWRVVLVADTLAGIVESTFVNDLNPPSRVADASWIRPGRVAWSWWSDHDSPRNYEAMRQFVDLAAEMGWEYFLVDANWTLMDGGNVRQLADYAKQKGVGLFLWYNSGGAHNIVTEKPRGCMTSTEVRTFELELLQQWGIVGVKIDFFQSDKQDIIGLYHGILRDTAEHRIMTNFHGCTVPRGWERTWPHLMTMEAVRGEECYTFAEDYPAKAPAYNATIAFTRNVVGPMDYTPCAFSDDKYPHLTTNAHELALMVVFESGLVHLADRVSAYRNVPAEVQTFLRDVPAAWDDIHFIDGAPGEFVVLARRQGTDWYVGAINGGSEPRPVQVPLAFLDEKTYNALLIGDGSDARSFDCKRQRVGSTDTLAIPMRPYGGAAIQLKPR